MEVLACVQEGVWLQTVLQEAAVASCPLGPQGAVASALTLEAEMSVTAEEVGWVEEEY